VKRKLTLVFPLGRSTVLSTGAGAVANSIAASSSSPISTDTAADVSQVRAGPTRFA